MPDSLTLIMPVHNPGPRLETVLSEWLRFLEAEFEYTQELVVVDDGSTDGTAAVLNSFVSRCRVLSHEKRRGFGACIRTALEVSHHPIVAYVGLDYPHSPSDLKTLLARLGKTVSIYDREMSVEAVSGCRSGREASLFWKSIGRGYRAFCRIALGVGGEKNPGWFGFREHARSWFLWVVMGVPLYDVNSEFKAFRRSLFDRFPIQSDGDFVHAEIFAKLTFLGVLIDEPTLTPQADVVPRVAWRDFWTVFTDAKFHSPLPDLTKPAISGA